MGTKKYFAFFLVFGLASLGYCQNNIVYDLNDPRNPSCPCHKIQRLAEDQHSKQVKESKTFDNLSSNKRNHKIYFNGGICKSVKKDLKKFQNRKFNYSKRRLQRRKVKPDYSVCFKW